MRPLVAGLALAASAAGAQPTNHIGGPLAEIFVASGCRMTETAAAAALIAQGWVQSDMQAQAMALANGGYLVSEGGEPQMLRLVNWPPCS